jgi:iron-sulfur cluster assembly protein
MSEITLTEAAVQQFKKDQVDREAEDHYIRVGVVAGGCRGFSQSITFVEEDDYKSEDDILVEQDDLKVIVDKKSLIYIQGTIIDWFEDPNDMARRGYVFQNPNAQGGTCGCGSSFSV